MIVAGEDEGLGAEMIMGGWLDIDSEEEVCIVGGIRTLTCFAGSF